MYLTRTSYSPETWARLLATAEEHRSAAMHTIEAVGGTLHGFWYVVGAHDGYTLWEGPEAVPKAAVECSLAGGETRSAVATTALLTVDDIKDARHRTGERTAR
jgi:hypothetical protein